MGSGSTRPASVTPSPCPPSHDAGNGACSLRSEPCMTQIEHISADAPSLPAALSHTAPRRRRAVAHPRVPAAGAPRLLGPDGRAARRYAPARALPQGRRRPDLRRLRQLRRSVRRSALVGPFLAGAAATTSTSSSSTSLLQNPIGIALAALLSLPKLRGRRSTARSSSCRPCCPSSSSASPGS